eukprot:6944860-Pyramimonas_sp.AAC.1
MALSARARPATGALAVTNGQQLRQSVSARCSRPGSRSMSFGQAIWPAIQTDYERLVKTTPKRIAER